jgi:release factor glutamine methyltransferase
VTVLEAIQRSAGFLARKGVDSPRLQTELLLAHLLKLPRMRLYLNFERVLQPAEVDAFRELIRRRGQREPLQYIVGTTSFCGLELAVNPRVLIPRPETELLAERGWQFLNQLAGHNSAVDASEAGRALAEARGGGGRSVTALDVGTGSGCLALALAVKCLGARVQAVDDSAEALEVARQNAERLGVGERVTFRPGDGFAAVAPGFKFDLIISNPPYIATAELETLQPEVCFHEPRQALAGGADGLDFFRRLTTEAGPFLEPGGRLMLEFGDGQADAIREMFVREKWIVEAIHDDYTHRPRIAVLKREP